MNKASILGLQTAFVFCKFYQKHFKVLNRHSWRCSYFKSLWNTMIVQSVFVENYIKDFEVSKYIRDHVKQLHH